MPEIVLLGSATALVGETVRHRGRDYVFKGLRTKAGAKGNPVRVAGWSCACVKCGSEFGFDTGVNYGSFKAICPDCYGAPHKRDEIRARESEYRTDIGHPSPLEIRRAVIKLGPVACSLGRTANRKTFYAPALLRKAYDELERYTWAEIEFGLKLALREGGKGAGYICWDVVGRYKNRMPRYGLKPCRFDSEARRIIDPEFDELIRAGGDDPAVPEGWVPPEASEKEPDTFSGGEPVIERDTDPYAWFQPHPGNQHGRIMDFVKTHAVSDGCVTVADAVGVLARKDKLKPIEVFKEHSAEDWIGASLSRLGVLEKEPDKFDSGLFD